jgi:hypothetical protein
VVRVKKKGPQFVEYGGLRLQLTAGPMCYGDSPVVFSGRSRRNWTVLFDMPADRVDPVKAALGETGKVLYGLDGGPARVVSLCCVKWHGGQVWEWSFWTEELTDFEVGLQELKEVASG